MTVVADSAGAAEVVRATLASTGLEWDEAKPAHFVVTLPGEHKQKTACSLVVGSHAMSVNAFVARHVDENHEQVQRWLLERNARMYAVAFALDQHGDIYLTGRVPLHAVTPDEIDRVLGAVLEYADGAFDVILAMGFPSAIRREYSWRVKQGEPTDSLEAFDHLTRDL